MGKNRKMNLKKKGSFKCVYIKKSKIKQIIYLKEKDYMKHSLQDISKFDKDV